MVEEVFIAVGRELLYDEDFEETGGVGGIKVTYGKPQMRD